jgi:hypothetical protein
VALAQRILTERSLDPAGERIADPDDGAQKDDAEDKLKRCDHRFVSVIFAFTPNTLNAQLMRRDRPVTGLELSAAGSRFPCPR